MINTKAPKKLLNKSGSPTEPKAARNIFYNHSDREVYTYSIVVLVKGEAEVGIMSAIGAFSNYRMDQVSPLNSATLTGQSYFRNLSFMIPEYKPPAASTDQMSYKKSVKKEQLERVFNGAALSIVRPTAIYALFKFKRVQANCTTKLYLAVRKLSIRAFIKWYKETQYFNWNMALPLTLAYCSKYSRAVESAAVCHRGR